MNKVKVEQQKVLYHEFETTEVALDIGSVLNDAVTRGAVYLILDEIQYVQNYDSIVRNINDRHNEVQIILCGSTTGMARYLCAEIGVKWLAYIDLVYISLLVVVTKFSYNRSPTWNLGVFYALLGGMSTF